jgi:hypothetical protein
MPTRLCGAPLKRSYICYASLLYGAVPRLSLHFRDAWSTGHQRARLSGRHRITTRHPTPIALSTSHYGDRVSRATDQSLRRWTPCLGDQYLAEAGNVGNSGKSTRRMATSIGTGGSRFTVAGREVHCPIPVWSLLDLQSSRNLTSTRRAGPLHHTVHPARQGVCEEAGSDDPIVNRQHPVRV